MLGLLWFFVSIPGFLLTLLGVIAGGYIYYTWNFNVLKELGIPHAKPVPVLGTMYLDFKHGIQEVDTISTKLYGKVYGFYQGRKPAIVVGDPELLKEVLVKSFSAFHNRPTFPLRHKLMVQNLPDLKDDHWKLVRSYLTPTFSSGKMRKMAPLITHAADQLIERIDENYKDKLDCDMKLLAGNYTMEVIASVAFGIQLNTQKEANHPFVENARKPFEVMTTSKLFLVVFLLPFLIPILEFFNVAVDNVESVNFFKQVVESTLKERRANFNKKARPDFLHLMVEAEKNFYEGKNDNDDDDDDTTDNYTKTRGMTTDEITASSIIFLLGGYETTATTLTFLSYNLAVHPECQERVYEEIIKYIPGDEEPNYDNVLKLQYLDQCIDETLRITPPASRLVREATEDVEIQGQRFPKGMMIVIPVKTLQNDPEVWPEPDKFDPDRFSPEAKASRNPYCFCPFGHGPRSCVGMRLAEMELKILVAKCLKKYKFVRNQNTVVPLRMNKHSFFAKSLDPITVGLETRS